MVKWNFQQTCNFLFHQKVKSNFKKIILNDTPTSFSRTQLPVASKLISFT